MHYTIGKGIINVTNEQKHFIPNFDVLFIDLFHTINSSNNYFNSKILFDDWKTESFVLFNGLGFQMHWICDMKFYPFTIDS